MMATLGPYELNTIVTGDARELAKAIPDESVDIALLDPPYGIAWRSARRIATERFDAIEGDKEIDTTWMSDLYRITRGAAFVFTRWDVMEVWRQAMIAAGFDVRNCIVWDKGFHGAEDLTGAFAPQHEFILFGAKPGFKLQVRKPDMVTVNRVNPNYLTHPAEKPEAIMIHVLEATSSKDDIVLDMFTGSGTVPAVCKMLGRNYLAFEIDAATAEQARQRVANTNPPLFVLQPEQLAFDSD